MENSLLMSGKAAAALLGVAEGRMKKLRENAGLPFVLLERRPMYRRQDLEKWLESVTKTNAVK
ncbi:MAG: hypothetical protein SFV81_20210 [Pirellulaceae bacterium]|nr:hypothetical protein [Pirellulaceae bacterium]